MQIRFIITLLLPAITLLAGCQSRPLAETCYQKPASGHCRAAFTRYYFDENRQQCRPFIWGGCEGSVPFEDLPACRQECERSAIANEGEQHE